MPFDRLIAFPLGICVFKCTDMGHEHIRELYRTNIMFVEESRPNSMLRVRVPSMDGSGFDNGIVPACDVRLVAGEHEYKDISEYEKARDEWEREDGTVQ